MNGELTLGRSCGGCTACCKTHAVPVIDKPAGSWCTACIKGKGCGIYEYRPQPCQTYKCAWLEGVGSDEERPDRSKIIVDYEEFALSGFKTFRVWELQPGCLASPYGVRVCQHYLARGFSVLTVSLSGGRVFLPGAQVSLAAEDRRLLREDGVTDIRQLIFLRAAP